MAPVLTTIVQAAVSRRLYKEVYDLDLDFPISQSPRYKPHTFTDPKTAFETEIAEPYEYPPESDSQRDLMRPYSGIPPARNEQPVKPLLGLNKEARGWYCFLGEIFEVGSTTDGKHRAIGTVDADGKQVSIVFADTPGNDNLFAVHHSAIRPGHAVMVLLAKRRRLLDGVPPSECIWVDSPREVKFFETSATYLLDLEELIWEWDSVAQGHIFPQCFGCRMARPPEELALCPDCGLFWFCDKRAGDESNCHRMALVYRNHFDVCSLLGDPDLKLIYSGRYLAVDRFISPVVRRDFLIG